MMKAWKGLLEQEKDRIYRNLDDDTVDFDREKWRLFRVWFRILQYNMEMLFSHLNPLCFFQVPIFFPTKHILVLKWEENSSIFILLLNLKRSVKQRKFNYLGHHKKLAACKHRDNRVCSNLEGTPYNLALFIYELAFFNLIPCLSTRNTIIWLKIASSRVIFCK